MRSTFAANDAELIRPLLIDGFTFDSMISQQGELINKLRNLGLISIVSRQYKRCAYDQDDDYGCAEPECPTVFYLDEVNDDVVYCDYCKRETELDGKRVFDKYFIRLDSAEIFRFISQRFNQAGFDIKKIAHGWTKFEVKGKSCILCIPSHCTEAKYLSYHYVYSNPILYVYLPFVCPNQETLAALKYILLEDLICQDESWLKRKIEDALIVDVNLPLAEDLEQAFDKFVNKINNGDFEQFVSFIFNKIANSIDGIRKYEQLLKRNQDNIHGQYAVAVGGAGNSDGYIFKKRAYLSGLFDAKWRHLEGKRYISKNSILNDSKFSGFYSNCKEQPGAIFLANDLVTGDVWEQVKDFYDRDGYAKYAVVTKYLLLEIMAFIGGEDILEEFLGQIRMAQS